MYKIINKTSKENSTHTGHFPLRIAIELLEKGDDIIIISGYSNTVKVPYLNKDTNNYGETKSSHDWEFKSYSL